MKNQKIVVKAIAFLTAILILMCVAVMFAGCTYVEADASDYGSYQDRESTIDAANRLQYNQPTPTDIDYSLERYNLIRRAYWVNGQREKANALPCQVEKPLGYIVLFTESGGIVGKFVVDGKVSSLNSFLTPDSEYYEQEYWGDGDSANGANQWLADGDGSYGENDSGIFFFDIMGNYIEWTGIYLYTDIPMEIADPMINFEVSYTEVD